MNRTREQWAKIDAQMVSRAASQAAVFYLLRDAKQDIEALHTQIARLSDDSIKADTNYGFAFTLLDAERATLRNLLRECREALADGLETPGTLEHPASVEDRELIARIDALLEAPKMTDTDALLLAALRTIKDGGPPEQHMGLCQNVSIVLMRDRTPRAERHRAERRLDALIDTWPDSDKSDPRHALLNWLIEQLESK